MTGTADDDLHVDLMTALHRYRISTNISQRRIAQLMGTSQSSVSDIEYARTNLRIGTLLRYIRALGCRPSFIVHTKDRQTFVFDDSCAFAVSESAFDVMMTRGHALTFDDDAGRAH